MIEAIRDVTLYDPGCSSPVVVDILQGRVTSSSRAKAM